MKVLVTGDRGYIGTVMVPMLQANGHDVAGIDSDLFEQCTFTGTISNVPSVKKDIRDIEFTDLEGFDALIHLAGLSNDPLGDYKPELTYSINYEASIRLAKMAKTVGIGRFVFSSSCSNYGAAGSDFLTEETDFNPVTPYGKSKVRVEQELLKLGDSNFTPVLMRSSTAYGVSPRLRFDFSSIHRWKVIYVLSRSRNIVLVSHWVMHYPCRCLGLNHHILIRILHSYIQHIVPATPEQSRQRPRTEVRAVLVVHVLKRTLFDNTCNVWH